MGDELVERVARGMRERNQVDGTSWEDFPDEARAAIAVVRAELDAEKECRRQEVEAQQSAFNFLHKENEELREALREARDKIDELHKDLCSMRVDIGGSDDANPEIVSFLTRIDALLNGGGDDGDR